MSRELDAAIAALALMVSILFELRKRAKFYRESYKAMIGIYSKIDDLINKIEEGVDKY